MTSAVIRYEPPASSTWSEKLVSKLQDPEYRHAYMMEGVKTWIARQVRALREQRGWSQDDFGRKTGKPQPVISRMEDPDYGKLTVKTLLELAAAYDVALLVQFVEWNDWLNRMGDVSIPALEKQSFNERQFLPRKSLPVVRTGNVVLRTQIFVADMPAPSVTMMDNQTARREEIQQTANFSWKITPSNKIHFEQVGAP